jgi:hypothetical protein
VPRSRRDEAAAKKAPRRTVDVRRGLEGLLSLPPPGGNGLDCYNTIRSHETDASVVSAAIKCQAEVAGTRFNSLQRRPTEAA